MHIVFHGEKFYLTKIFAIKQKRAKEEKKSPTPG